jgi:hypothetical protein
VSLKTVLLVSLSQRVGRWDEKGKTRMCRDYERMYILSGCQFNSTGTEVHLHIFIGDNRQKTTGDEGVDGILANEVSIARILRVDSDACVANDGFWTSCGDDNCLIRSFNGVFEVQEDTEFDLLVVAWHIK